MLLNSEKGVESVVEERVVEREPSLTLREGSDAKEEVSIEFKGVTDLTKSVFLLSTIGELSEGVVSRVESPEPAGVRVSRSKAGKGIRVVRRT